MLITAMDEFTVLRRKHIENEKAQYTDILNENKGAKTYFRASELGLGDRKIIYSFFAHQLPTRPKSPQNLRQLENGDKVHERYQTAWTQMGAVIGMEERLSSKDDEYLGQFDWNWTGHYDALLDVNIIRAFALGKATLHSYYNEETDEWDLEVEIDESYANAIGLFDDEGNIAEDYEPLPMVADIKTMNPWGFKRIKENGDVSDIQGYIDQISFYMYMLNTPYGSIFIEAKDNQDVVEVQVLWKDLHEDIEYTWDPDIHGEQTDNIVRVVIDSERFFGSESYEGVVPRINRLWGIVQELKKAEAEGDEERIKALIPARCSDKPDAFPCSWGHRTGKPTYCEFYEHCWSNIHQGLAIRTYEPLPAEARWEFNDDEGNLIIIDNRKVPQGVDYNGFINLVEMGVLDYTKFLADLPTQAQKTSEEAFEDAINEDNLFESNGELKLDIGMGVTQKEAPTEAIEYINEDGTRAIDCLNCGKQVTYNKLGNGMVKKCPHCKHTNKVTRKKEAVAT